AEWHRAEGLIERRQPDQRGGGHGAAGIADDEALQEIVNLVKRHVDADGRGAVNGDAARYRGKPAGRKHDRLYRAALGRVANAGRGGEHRTGKQDENRQTIMLKTIVRALACERGTYFDHGLSSVAPSLCWGMLPANCAV